tara:strand:- start:11567 stop:12217 length:651 start_codon:yes stop_codon:yes gene_type:complete
MYKLASLPTNIPIFPLGNALLLPHSRLPLNIFEPRYLAMLDDVLKTDHRLIGMIQPIPSDERIGNPQVKSIGCAGRLTSFSEASDRHCLITLTGACRFRVERVHNGFLPYATADINWDEFGDDLNPAKKDAALDRPHFMAVLERYFQVMDLSTDWNSMKDAEDEMLINSLAMLCPFAPEEKQALLEAPTMIRRFETLITLMEFALRENSGDKGVLQ